MFYSLLFGFLKFYVSQFMAYQSPTGFYPHRTIAGLSDIRASSPLVELFRDAIFI
jgi:hypothetical protein